MIDKHIKLTQVCVDILDEMIQMEGVKNYSEAVRIALMEHGDEKIKSENLLLSKKIDEMSRDVSVLLRMVAGGFAECDVSDIPKVEDCAIYHNAKGQLSEDIQRAVTGKSGHKLAPKKSTIDG